MALYNTYVLILFQILLVMIPRLPPPSPPFNQFKMLRGYYRLLTLLVERAIKIVWGAGGGGVEATSLASVATLLSLSIPCTLYNIDVDFRCQETYRIVFLVYCWICLLMLV